MNRLLLALLALLLLLSGCVAPPPPLAGSSVANPIYAAAPTSDQPAALTEEALPFDPAVRTGVLANGLTYYIRANDQPQNRAELRLVINAGSILEDEDQLGLAHFLEHMLFNGTERFPKQELVSFLESIGMEFGPDLNAYTSFDETVYMLQVPTGDDELLTQAFNVLEDWAAYALIEPEEVEKERGVVIEEWRLADQNASGRLQNQILPVLLSGSHYAVREPIGDPEIIRNAPAEAIRRFYETWYRPDLMAVVAVGDFDPDAIEQQVQDHFADLPVPNNPVERPTFAVPELDETQYLVATDPEFSAAQVVVFFRRPGEAGATVADLRSGLITGLFSDMLNNRFTEISRRADSPFLLAGTGQGEFVRAVEVAQVFAQVEDDKIESGLNAILTEVERARQHGFTASELERAKQNLLRSYQTAYNERGDTDSASFAGSYVDHYLTGSAVPGIEAEFALVQDLLPQITVADVNARVSTLVGEENRTVIVVAPEKEGLSVPTEAALADVIAAVEGQEIEPYVDAAVDSELFADVPQPAAITEQRTIDELGVTEIVLENGIRVIMKPTDFQQDEIVFSARSPGGTSLVSDEDYPEAAMITSVIVQSGVGNLSQTELERLLAGKEVSVIPQLADQAEGFGGRAATADVETLFQLIHLYATAPRVDSDAFEAWRNQQRAALENRDLDPFAALVDAYLEKVYNNHPRVALPTLAQIDGLDLARGLEIYQERFADMGDFTFTFAGNFTIEELSALAQSYLGTLPATARVDEPLDVEPDFPAGVTDVTVYKGQDELSLVQLIFHSAIDPTLQNRLTAQFLSDILGLRLDDVLREELGGVYFAQTFADVELEPDQEFSLVVYFTTDPARLDELLTTVFAEIEQLRAAGPQADTLAAVKEQALRGREEALEDNGFWVSQLEFYAEHPTEDATNILTFRERVNAVSADDIQSLAQAQVSDEQYIKIVLFPAAYEPE